MLFPRIFQQVHGALERTTENVSASAIAKCRLYYCNALHGDMSENNLNKLHRAVLSHTSEYNQYASGGPNESSGRFAGDKPRHESVSRSQRWFTRSEQFSIHLVSQTYSRNTSHKGITSSSTTLLSMRIDEITNRRLLVSWFGGQRIA